MLRVMDRPCPFRCPAHLLLGDFNARPDAPELTPLWATLRDADPGAPTFPASAPDRRIDYVFVGWPKAGGAGHVTRCTVEALEPVEGVVPSDHLAVLAELRY